MSKKKSLYIIQLTCSKLPDTCCVFVTPCAKSMFLCHLVKKANFCDTLWKRHVFVTPCAKNSFFYIDTLCKKGMFLWHPAEKGIFLYTLWKRHVFVTPCAKKPCFYRYLVQKRHEFCDTLCKKGMCFVTPCAKNESKPHENEMHETASFEQSRIDRVNKTKHRKHRLASKIGKFFISNASIVMQPVYVALIQSAKCQFINGRV